MLGRTAGYVASLAAALALVIGPCLTACQREEAGGWAETAPQDTAADAANVVSAADLSADVAGPAPLVVVAGDALRPALEGDVLALLTLDEGGTLCLSRPWREDCVTRVRLLDIDDGSPIFSSTDVYATTVPLLEDRVLYWAGPDNRVRFHAIGGAGIVQPLAEHPDFYGIQAPVLVRDRGLFWYAYDYGRGAYAFHRYDVDDHAVQQVMEAQHDWPWFLSDLGAPPAPQFDIDEDHAVWLHHKPYGDTWHYQIVLADLHGGDAPETLPTGDVNCLWPRLRGDWVYYLWFSQDDWECNQLKCIFHLSRVHLETGEVEAVEDEGARVTGLYPPQLWDGGVGWLDFRDGGYRIVVRPDGGEPVAVTPPELPVGVFGGVDLVPLEDGRLRVLWSTLYEGKLQIFAEDFDG